MFFKQNEPPYVGSYDYSNTQCRMSTLAPPKIAKYTTTRLTGSGLL